MISRVFNYIKRGWFDDHASFWNVLVTLSCLFFMFSLICTLCCGWMFIVYC